MKVANQEGVGPKSSRRSIDPEMPQTWKYRTPDQTMRTLGTIWVLGGTGVRSALLGKYFYPRARAWAAHGFERNPEPPVNIIFNL